MEDEREALPKKRKVVELTPKQKCVSCHQSLDCIIFYQNHLENAMEEPIALTDERLGNAFYYYVVSCKENNYLYIMVICISDYYFLMPYLNLFCFHP